MRAGLVAFLAALACSCAAPSLKEYEDRVARGRARLAAIAKSQLDAHPNDEQLLVIYGALSGERGAQAAIEMHDPDMGPLGALILCKTLLWETPGEPWSMPPAEEVEEAFAVLDSVMPDSSLPPLYRLRWLKLSTTGNRLFWLECQHLFEEALRRNRWDSPIRAFFKRWLDWLDEHEPDDFVKASIDLRLSDSHMGSFIWFARLLDALLYSPAPPDPLILDVARLFQEVNDRILWSSPNPMDYMFGSIVARMVMPARFLGLWRSGELAGAEAVASDLDRNLKLEQHWSAYKVGYMARFEAKMYVFNAGLSRMAKTFEATLKEGKPNLEKSFKGGLEALAETGDDSELQLEGCRRLEAGARDYLIALREELCGTEPLAPRVMHHPPKEAQLVNALRWVLRDRKIIAGGPFPKELVKEAFNWEYEMGTEHVGIHHYRWLLKESLMKADSIPVAELKSTKVGRIDEHFDLALILHGRGHPLDDSECKTGIDQVKDFAMTVSMKGYCQLLTLRTKEDRPAAAAMLPDYNSKHIQEAWAMIGETLRHVTGQDFGFDLSAWKIWLTQEPKD